MEHPGNLRMYQYEDGHILDVAAMNGDAKMVQLLLDFNMTVGPAAMAHAAHFNHTDVMEVCAGGCIAVAGREWPASCTRMAAV